MKTVNLRFYSDGGHGWLAVKLSYLQQLGIADAISAYSYKKGETAYLEEDCDCGVFARAAEAQNWTVNVNHVWHGDYSPIRYYAPYKPFTR